MRLLIDAGNTRLKWMLEEQGAPFACGACLVDSDEWVNDLRPYASKINRIAVATVVSEIGRKDIVARLAELSDSEVRFYWSEASRGGLKSAYSDVGKMGVDRWHAMYAGWHQEPSGFAVVDAGSAITVYYVADSGDHLGGYILPGKQMMLRSLTQDAARVGFDPLDARSGTPGRSTTECVQHGVVWLWEGLARTLTADCHRYGLKRVLCTGGDAPALMAAGLTGQHDPDLVLRGLAAVDSENSDS